MQIDGVRCPACGSTNTIVKDSRIVEDGRRRRRECTRCKERFSSWEFAEDKIPDFEAKELAQLIDNLETLTMRALAIVQRSKKLLNEKENEND